MVVKNRVILVVIDKQSLMCSARPELWLQLCINKYANKVLPDVQFGSLIQLIRLRMFSFGSIMGALLLECACLAGAHQQGSHEPMIYVKKRAGLFYLISG